MRYQVKYGDKVGAKRRYALWDSRDRICRFASDSKSEVIEQAQRWNKLEPVDGDEGTYGRQILAARERPERAT